MKNNLKIAIQLYGHLRTFEVCAPSLKKHLLDFYDCDVFIHTWDKTEHTTKSWYDESVKSDPFAVDDYVIKKVHSLYNPKSILIEAQNLFDERGSFGTSDRIKISLQGLKYMLYGQYQANTLRRKYQEENNIKYDFILTVRPDVQLFADIDFIQFKNEFAFNPRSSIHFLHRSEIKLCENKFFNYPLVADCLYFSTPEIMDEITGTLNEFNRYFKEINLIFPLGVENPELAIFERLHQKGITPRQYQFYFAIKRKNDKDDIKLTPPAPVKNYSNWELVTSSELSLKQKTKNLIKLAINAFLIFSPKFILKSIKRILYWASVVDRYLKMREKE